MTRDEAYKIAREWVTNDNLLGHMLALEAVMRFYAEKYGEDVELWGMAGLLHDCDWEKYPEEHPQKILEHLKEIGAPAEVIQAINAHGGKGAIEPTSLMDKVLFASDELSGFVVAAARMRPTKLEGMEASSVVKKMKDKRFAANVSREDITHGAEMISIDLKEHINNVIGALLPISDKLGL
jgi:putative nucleotidyltransferase with HDIG domain